MCPTHAFPDSKAGWIDELDEKVGGIMHRARESHVMNPFLRVLQFQLHLPIMPFTKAKGFLIPIRLTALTVVITVSSFRLLLNNY